MRVDVIEEVEKGHLLSHCHQERQGLEDERGLGDIKNLMKATMEMFLSAVREK